jgi:hypothetical protein
MTRASITCHPLHAAAAVPSHGAITVVIMPVTDMDHGYRRLDNGSLFFSSLQSLGLEESYWREPSGMSLRDQILVLLVNQLLHALAPGSHTGRRVVSFSSSSKLQVTDMTWNREQGHPDVSFVHVRSMQITVLTCIHCSHPQ